SQSSRASADRVMPTPGGSVGLLHLSSADLGPAGILRVSAMGEYFRGFDFPVPAATGTHAAGTVAISFVPVEILELFIAYRMVASNNSGSALPRSQSIGDFAGGLKLSRRWATGLYAGIEAKGQFSTRFGDDGVQRVYRYGIEPK